MAQIAAEPIKFPDDEDVAGAERFEAGHKRRAIGALAGCLVLINRILFDAGCVERIALEIQALGAINLGDAGVADQHVPYMVVCDAAASWHCRIAEIISYLVS